MLRIAIPRVRLREEHVVDEPSFFAAFGRALECRGFRLDKPIHRESTEEELCLVQDDVGRVPATDPQLSMLISAMRPDVPSSIGAVLEFLKARGDDRATIMETLAGDGGDDLTANIDLCRKVALLLGRLRQPDPI